MSADINVFLDMAVNLGLHHGYTVDRAEPNLVVLRKKRSIGDTVVSIHINRSVNAWWKQRVNSKGHFDNGWRSYSYSNNKTKHKNGHEKEVTDARFEEILINPKSILNNNK